MSQPEDQNNLNSRFSNARLHDELENISHNNSGNRPFADVLKVNMSRRKILQGSAATAATSFLAPTAFAGLMKDSTETVGKSRKLVNFEPVSIESTQADPTWPVISPDYEFQVLIPWGTPLEPGSTAEYAGDPDSRPTPEEAALQIGIGHDGMWFFPIDSHKGRAYKKQGYRPSSSAGMLCINHEYGENIHVLGKEAPESLEDVRRMQHAMGLSVVALKKHAKTWSNVASKNARRIHVNSPVMFSGPAADSELLQNPAGNVALGTLNNCGSGHTPWDTYLTCEENFNGYFGASMAITLSEEQERYGLAEDGFGYGWHQFDKRFDLSDEDYVNEYLRFGWVMEVDPFDATQTPVKRTALGRFKHEAIAIGESEDGRIAAYMGDDEVFNYCYKYISNASAEASIAAGNSPLDDGKLYVARFNDDGSGDWLELTIDNPALAERFNSQAEVLIYARIAADIVGATPMDRPEWTTVGKNGEVYWTMTNNSSRTDPNAANPEAPNPDGHIIRTTGAHTGTSFEWEIFILASSTAGTEGTFTDPDAAWADPYGRLFIGTDGGQPDGLQDQLTVFDTTAATPVPMRLFNGVDGDEITGFTVTPDQRTAFINIQHPGNGDPAVTNFPAPRDYLTVPRDCTIVITKKDGGIIGS